MVRHRKSIQAELSKLQFERLKALRQYVRILRSWSLFENNPTTNADIYKVMRAGEKHGGFVYPIPAVVVFFEHLFVMSVAIYRRFKGDAQTVANMPDTIYSKILGRLSIEPAKALGLTSQTYSGECLRVQSSKDRAFQAMLRNAEEGVEDNEVTELDEFVMDHSVVVFLCALVHVYANKSCYELEKELVELAKREEAQRGKKPHKSSQKSGSADVSLRHRIAVKYNPQENEEKKEN